jgi:hypothetical protein
MARNKPRPIPGMKFPTRHHPALPELIDALTPVVRPAMLEKFEPNCCIPTCRILRDVFARFGYAAEALPCAVFIQNAAMLEYYASTVPEEEEEERVRVYARLGAWRIDVMPNSNKSRGFEGHVVIRVEQMLVDASLQQVDRPVKKIFMPPLLAFEPGEAFFDKPSGQGVVGIVNGCSVAYQRLTDYRFHNSPLWLDDGWPYSDVHKKIVRQTQARLGYYG